MYKKYNLAVLIRNALKTWKISKCQKESHFRITKTTNLTAKYLIGTEKSTTSIKKGTSKTVTHFMK